MARIEIDVDASEVSAVIDMMRSKLTPGEFEKLMRRSLGETAQRLKKPIVDESRKRYEVKAGFVRAGIKPYKFEGSGGDVAVKVPLRGPKGTIGGTFAAKGGHYGWNPPKYQIRAKILKGKESTLPDSIAGQGGQPPFRNVRNAGRWTSQKGQAKPEAGNGSTAGSIGGTVMTRRGSGRFPIKHVSAVAMPQMPLNQARPGVEKVIVETLDKRIEHNFGYMFGK